MMLYLSRFSPHSNLRDFPLGCHPGRLSRFHTSDFFCSNAGFHVLANLDFSPFLTRTICIPTKLGSRFLRGDFPVFRPNFNGGPRLSEISLFFARFRRLDSSVGGSGGWIRPLQPLLAHITAPITAISYYISITLGARSILYCAAGNTREYIWRIQLCC